jgi:hypothetical protein
VDRPVQYRAVEPDDMLDVVFNFGRIRFVQLGVVRGEVAVRDDMVVLSAWLVDVLRRKRRRKRQERRDDREGGDAGQPNHKEIIGGMR